MSGGYKLPNKFFLHRREKSGLFLHYSRFQADLTIGKYRAKESPVNANFFLQVFDDEYQSIVVV